MEVPADPTVDSSQNEETKTNDQAEFEESDSKFRTPEGTVKVPEVGMTFKNYEEVLEYYRQYAWQVGFDVRVKRTTFTDTGQHYTVEFMCHRGGKGKTDPTYQSKPTAKTDCEATLQLKLEIDGLLHLRKVVLEHNHDLDPSLVKWMKRGRRRLSLAMKSEPEGGMDSGKKRRKRYRWVPPDKTEDGVDCMQNREVNSKTSTSNKGRLMLQEEDIEALYQFFRDMQIKEPNFFYMVDLDRECRLRNVFWADSMARVSFKAFGDVVLFETSYLASDYDVPLALFLGVNHHGQLVLLGCALLSDTTSETYDWLFRTWLACMEQCSPQGLITDQIEATRDPISRIFPETRHRFCPRQILKRLSDNLKKHEKYKEIKSMLIKIVYNSYKCEDFEQEWKAMVEGYSLEENLWINSLYEIRHEWVPVFLKNEFWAGISISQQGYSPFFEGSMHPDTSLKQFLSNYETVIGNKYEKMAQADVESSHKGPLLVSKFYMEEQVAEHYTYNIFKEFQEELRGTMYCDMLQIKAVDPSQNQNQNQNQNQIGSIFEIKESVFLEDGADVAEYRVFDVYFEPTEMELSCPCGLFQNKGILCRHTLSVLKLQQIYEIPLRYIVDRWRKDYYFRQLYNSYTLPTNNYSAKNHFERSRSLSERCIRVSNLGMASDERCEVLVRLMAEVERVLLSPGPVGKNVQFKLVQCENRGGESSSDMIMTEGSDKSLKRRGRPPKKRNDGTVDGMITAKKRTDTIGTSYMESDMFLAAPPNLEAHVDSQENMILMGTVDPNVLSLGNQYGMQANRPYTSADPSRALSSNMMQAQFEQQAAANPARSQWIYHQMLQDNQLPTHHGQGN